MSNMEVIITPGGKLRLVGASNQKSSASGTTRSKRKQSSVDLPEDCQAAFLESPAEGITELQKLGPETMLSPSVQFWRQFGQQFFHWLCHHSDASPSRWKKLPLPRDEEFESTISAAPPMLGIEFLTIEFLRSIWHELAKLASVNALSAEKPEDYLQSVNPQLHLLGRVTFHLAENKSDSQRPFAFMATYTSRVSQKSKLQHLPLGQAIKQYAGAQNRETLRSLLAPISRAAERDPVTRELLDSKAIFHPQAWTVAQAH